MKHALRWLIAAVLMFGLVAVALSSLVVVDETEYAVVTSFGQIAAVYGDEPCLEAGLHMQGAVAARAPRSISRVKIFEPRARAR